MRQCPAVTGPHNGTSPWSGRSPRESVQRWASPVCRLLKILFPKGSCNGGFPPRDNICCTRVNVLFVGLLRFFPSLDAVEVSPAGPQHWGLVWKSDGSIRLLSKEAKAGVGFPLTVGAVIARLSRRGRGVPRGGNSKYGQPRGRPLTGQRARS